MDVSAAAGLRCAMCDAALEQGDVFCEACGVRLVQDGADRPHEAGNDRIELDLAIAAAVSDRGLVHRRNEDAFRVEVIGERAVAAVVCDGISSASAGDAAAVSAAGAAATVLAQALRDAAADASCAILEAIRAANGAVEQVPWTTRANRGMPSCTLVCALLRDGEIVIGSVGDSRAYLIDSAGTCQLTVDDSWAQEQVADGLLTPEQAMKDRRAHAITHWIGADAPERAPRLAALRPDGPGRLVLCTDGLWNYVATADELGELISALPPGAAPAAVASALTDTAVNRGGRDNITVAVIDIPPS
jgi:serine/threonine protein phosphatase PrpC